MRLPGARIDELAHRCAMLPDIMRPLIEATHQRSDTNDPDLRSYSSRAIAPICFQVGVRRGNIPLIARKRFAG